MNQIPIANVFHLLVYAWNKLPESAVCNVSFSETNDVPNLLASVLVSATQNLVKKGLAKDYIEIEEKIAGVRGKLNLAASIKSNSFLQGKAVCRYDEFEVDNLKNRIIKATLLKLIRAEQIDSDLRKELVRLYRGFGDVSLVTITSKTFRSLESDRNHRLYGFVLSICELVQRLAIPDERGSGFRFSDFFRDERAMARVFESFVLNFYKIERDDLKVTGSEKITWDATSESDSQLGFLPSMRADISIRNKPHTKTLVIDTKYYKETLQQYYGNRTIHSGNLYQITSYLRNLEARDSADNDAVGMLLYPVVQDNIRLNYDVSGHEVLIRTIDLSKDWAEIKRELFGLVDQVFY